MLTHTQDEAEVCTHFVFDDFGVIITYHENSTYSVRVDARKALEGLLESDPALQELYDLYQKGDTQELKEEILIHLRSLLNQKFGDLGLNQTFRF